MKLLYLLMEVTLSILIGPFCVDPIQTSLSFDNSSCINLSLEKELKLIANIAESQTTFISLLTISLVGRRNRSAVLELDKRLVIVVSKSLEPFPSAFGITYHLTACLCIKLYLKLSLSSRKLTSIAEISSFLWISISLPHHCHEGTALLRTLTQQQSNDELTLTYYFVLNCSETETTFNSFVSVKSRWILLDYSVYE